MPGESVGPEYRRRVPAAVRFALTLLVGFGAGVLSGMFGLGGAVVSTPGIRVLGASALEAIGSTLPSVLPSSISGSFRYQQERLIRGRAVLITCVFGIPAAVVGSRLSDAVPGNGHVLMIATALLVGYTGAGPRFPGACRCPAGSISDEWWRFAVIGAAAGTLSGLLGVGGGMIMVPAFAVWIGLPLKETIATSLACVGILAIPGTLTHWYLGHIDWTFAIVLAVGVIPGAQVGARWTIAADDRTLRYTVGTALGIIAVIYLVGELLAWIRSARPVEHRVEHRGRQPAGEGVLLRRVERAQDRDTSTWHLGAVGERRPARWNVESARP